MPPDARDVAVFQTFDLVESGRCSVIRPDSVVFAKSVPDTFSTEAHPTKIRSRHVTFTEQTMPLGGSAASERNYQTILNGSVKRGSR